MAKALFMLGALFGLVACSPAAATPDFDLMAKWNSVLVGDKVRDFCSGAVVGGGTDQSGEFSIVLTAAHCTASADLTVSRRLDNRDQITVWKDTKPAVVLYKNESTDVAVLRTSLSNGGHYQAVAFDFEYTRGKTVYVLGNPGIEAYASLSRGIISAPPRRIAGLKNASLFQSDAFAMGGSSGSMVLNEDGAIVGAVSGGRPNTSIAYFSTIDNINAAILAAEVWEFVYRG